MYFRPTIPPRLDIPSWVPDAIAQYVSAKYAADVDRAYRDSAQGERLFRA